MEEKTIWWKENKELNCRWWMEGKKRPRAKRVKLPDEKEATKS